MLTAVEGGERKKETTFRRSINRCVRPIEPRRDGQIWATAVCSARAPRAGEEEEKGGKTFQPQRQCLEVKPTRQGRRHAAKQLSVSTITTITTITSHYSNCSPVYFFMYLFSIFSASSLRGLFYCCMCVCVCVSSIIAANHKQNLKKGRREGGVATVVCPAP
jgi:hypothetical protein